MGLKRPRVADPHRGDLKIVDERCTCGNLRSNHSSMTGRGPSDDCDRFVWAAFVLEDGTDLSNEVIPW